MNKKYACHGQYEAIDYGKFAQIFWKGMEWETITIPDGTPFETAFEMWLDQELGVQ